MNKNLPKWLPYVIVGLVVIIVIAIIISNTGKKPQETAVPSESPTSVASTPAPAQPVQKSPDEEAYEKARDLYYEGKYKEAIEAYRKFIQDFPKSEYADDAQYEIAMCYEFMEDYKKAIEEYEKLIKNYPNSEYVDGAKASIEYLKEYTK